MSEERVVNAEAGDYIEDDPAAWDAWLAAVRRYGPQFNDMAVHLGSEDAAAEVLAGAMLSALADTHGLYLRRDDPVVSVEWLAQAMTEAATDRPGIHAEAEAIAHEYEKIARSVR